MNLFDLILMIVLGAGILWGWKVKALSILGLFLSFGLGIWMANRYHGRWILAFFTGLPPAVSHSLMWLFFFLGTAVVVSLVFHILSMSLEAVQLGWLDHALGAALAGLLLFLLTAVGLRAAEPLAQTYHWKFFQNSQLSQAVPRWSEPLLHLFRLPRFLAGAGDTRGKNTVPQKKSVPSLKHPEKYI